MISLNNFQKIVNNLPTSLAKELSRHPPLLEDEEGPLHPDLEVKELLLDPYITGDGGKFARGIAVEIHVSNKHYSLYLGFTKDGELVSCFDGINGSY